MRWFFRALSKRNYERSKCIPIRGLWDKCIQLYSFLIIDTSFVLSRMVRYSRFFSNRFHTMEALFHACTVCQEILSELFGGTTGLWTNALVFWQNAIGSNRKSFALINFKEECICQEFLKRSLPLVFTRDKRPKYISPLLQPSSSTVLGGSSIEVQCGPLLRGTGERVAAALREGPAPKSGENWRQPAHAQRPHKAGAVMASAPASCSQCACAGSSAHRFPLKMDRTVH